MARELKDQACVCFLMDLPIGSISNVLFLTAVYRRFAGILFLNIYLMIFLLLPYNGL